MVFWRQRLSPPSASRTCRGRKDVLSEPRQGVDQLYNTPVPFLLCQVNGSPLELVRRLYTLDPAGSSQTPSLTERIGEWHRTFLPFLRPFYTAIQRIAGF